MEINGKIKNPIHIRLGKGYDIIMKDEVTSKDYPLIPGSFFEEGRYGFVLITEHNGKQSEEVYSTQCRIQAVGMEDGVLKIFEEGKKSPWRFDKNGKLEHSIFGEFTDEFRSKLDVFAENEELFLGNPVLMDPVTIRIEKRPEESVILKDEVIDQNYPLHPGARFGNAHYGFILIIDTDDGQKEVAYPTQNKLYAAAVEGKNPYDDLKIFEDGKFHPWLFDYKGNLKQEASYNSYSRQDNEFVEEHYGLNVVKETVSEGRFVVKVK